MTSLLLPRKFSEILREVKRSLMDAGVSSASLESAEIVAGAAGIAKNKLYASLNDYADSKTVKRALHMLQRRLKGEPLAYILGSWDFMGLEFRITPDVLIPRIDTEALALAAIGAARSFKPPCRVLDLCAGSGCIGVSIAKNVPGCRVVLADSSRKALRLARHNAREHGLTGSVSCIEANVCSPPVWLKGSFELVACNPPYIPTGDIAGLEASVREYEPIRALDGGADGLDFYRSITRAWTEILTEKGRLLFEVGDGQAGSVARMMEESGFADIHTLKDSQGIERVVAGEKK